MLLRKLKPIFSKTLTSMKCQRSLLSYEFSQQNQNIKSFDQGNAKLSLGVIDIISKKPSLRQINNISLTQRILKYIKEQQDISQESKQEISSLFTTGVDIRKDREVFSQQRIRRGEIEIPDQQNDQLQTLDNNKVQENHQNLKQNDIDQKIQKSAFSPSLFVFYPTYMVTSQIFKKIVRSSNGIDIFAGHMGISKTVSVFLLWKLVRYIDKYRFNPQNKVPKKYFNIPKIFYWSMAKRDRKQRVIERLLKQTQKQFNQLYSQNPIQNINNYYEKFPQRPFLLLIIDQINQIAQAKYIIQKLQKKLEKTQKQIKQLNKQKKYIDEVKQIFKEIMPKFEEVIYLSPISIEDKVSNEFDLSRAGKHQEAEQGQIHYSSLLLEDIYLQELVNYFFFEFEQRVKRQNGYKIFDKEETKKILKNKCHQYLKQNKGQYIITQKDFRLKINAKKNYFYKTLKKLSNEEQKINQVLNKFIKIVQQSTTQYGNFLKETFLKNDQNDYYRLKILFDIYKELIKIDKQLKQKIQSGQLKQQHYYSDIKFQYIKTKNIKWQDKLLCKFLDKRIFYYFQDKSYIQPRLPIKFTLRILQKHIPTYIKHYAQNHSTVFEIIIDKPQIGKFVKRFFLLALIRGNAGIKIITPSHSNIKFQKICHQQYWFQSIPIFNKDQKKSAEKQNILDKKQEIRRIIKKETQIRRSKSYQFLQSFIPFIRDAYLHKKQPNLLLLPGDIKSKRFPKKSFSLINQSIAKNNKCIDGILFRFVQGDQPLVQLYAFDLTTGNKATKKLKRFIKQFIAFKDRMNTKVKINLQDKLSKQINFNLYYYIINNKNFEKNIQSELNQEFGEYLNFKASSKFSQYKITSLQGSQSCLLKGIGCLNWQSDIEFINPLQKFAITFREAIGRSNKIDQQNKKAKNDQQ